MDRPGSTIVSNQRNGDWVEIHLALQPLSSALIVFDPEGTAPATIAVPAAYSLKRTEEIGATGWKLIAMGLVPSGDAAVIHRDLSRLIDWSLDDELRGFSGKGTYSTTFTMSALDVGSRLVLDLGCVKDVAEIAVNGKQAATLLLRPYQADITDFVQPGEHLLEVSVTNALFNSMVLREPRPFRAGSTENPSGLMSSRLIGRVQMKIMNY